MSVHVRRRGVIAGAAPSPFIVATGGDDVSDVTIGGVLFRVHQFTSVGTSSFVVSSLGDSDGEVEYLVVAGGGGGGANPTFSNTGAGGGGAGGYRSSVEEESSGGGASAETPLTLVLGTYTVTVGSGGAGNKSASSANGSPGSSSVFDSISASGGGFGGGASGDGGNGGSGGGASGTSGTSSGGTREVNQGFDGGSSSSNNSGGGGGGAASAGQDILTAGAGLSSLINGTATTRAEGGTGTGNVEFSASDALGNTGNGGDAGGRSAGSSGGNGGSGIVIIRYPLQEVA